MIVCIKLPIPDPQPVCFLTHFTSVLHETKRGKVLVDFPLSLTPERPTERRWVSKKWVAWTV